jgi:hypothetical protein
MILNLGKERSIHLIRIPLKTLNDIYKSATFWMKGEIYREFVVKETAYKPLVLLIEAINVLYLFVNENSKMPLWNGLY